MRYSVNDEGLTSKDRSDYQQQINPNTYVVIHLQQFVLVPFEHDTVGLEPYVRDERFGVRWASQDIYEGAAYQFVANVSKDVLGRTAYRNRPHYRKRLPNFVTLEYHGGSPHLNICIRRPDTWSLDDFTEVCKRHGEANQWLRMKGKSFYCEDRTGDCGRYSLKAGATILKRSMSFHR